MARIFDSKTAPEIAAQVGRRLCVLRLQRNETQADLARRAGVARPTVGALERDGRGTIETLARVAEALGREKELESPCGPDPPLTLDDMGQPVRRRARK